MLTFDQLVHRFHAKREGPQFKARCPAHDDRKASLALSVGESGAAIFHCHAGCRTEDVLRAMSLTWADVLPPKNGHADRIVAAYDYRDANGALLYQVLRYEPKSFRQRKPDGDGWTWKLGTVKRVLYRWPELQGADTVWLVEGEKDADRLVSIGLVATTISGGVNNWRKTYATQLKDANVRRVFILPDNDDPGRSFARTALAHLLTAGVTARILELPGLPPKGDVSDYLEAGHTREDLEALLTAPTVRVGEAPASYPRSLSMADAYRLSPLTVQRAITEWGLSTNARLEPHHSLENLRLAVERDPVFVGRIWYDEFLDKLLTGEPAREWRDDDDVGAAMYFQSRLQLHKLSPLQLHQVIDYVARQQPQHCVRAWLATLVWDGVPRVDTAFETYWGAEDTASHPLDYLRAASRNFFVGLVARVMQPGCKLDTMPVFEGGQGIYKSSALSALAAPWFATAHETMGTKDFLVTLRGKWLVEIAELQSFSRAEVTQIKNTLSNPVDTYRPPYGRASRDFPRQCVFAGSTNKDDWGMDETGLRRFWPVKCGVIQLDALRAARASLFAEACAIYRDRPDWWTMPTSTGAVQASRQQTDAWGELIAPILIEQTEWALTDLLKRLGLSARDQDMNAQRRLGKALQHLGWVSRNVRVDGRVVKRWMSKDDTLVV